MIDTSLCIRCGKSRIVAKTWKEKIGTGYVTYTQTVCPDPECQKIVDGQLKKKKDKLEAMQQESLKRRVKNKRNKKTPSNK